MELIVKRSFYRDINLVSDKKLLATVNAVIIEIEKAHSLAQIANLKKLRK